VLTLLEACWLLGFELHQARILMRKGTLIPLGQRKRGKAKVFATIYILGLAKDRDWLDEARDVLSLYWEKRNAARKARA
jgi:hypothetical protein